MKIDIACKFGNGDDAFLFRAQEMMLHRKSR